MTTTQKRFAIGAGVTLLAIIAIILLVYFSGFGSKVMGGNIGTTVEEANPLYGRLDRTFRKVEQKQNEVKNEKQAYATDKKTKAFLDSLKKSREVLKTLIAKAEPLLQYKDKDELPDYNSENALEGILAFVASKAEIDSVIEKTDLLCHNFQQYQIKEKNLTIEEQAEAIKKYKRLAQKYRTLYSNLNSNLETANALVAKLEMRIDSIRNNPDEAKQAEEVSFANNNNADSLQLELNKQMEIAEALRDSVDNYPAFGVVKVAPTPFKAKNFSRSNHWNLNHIEKNGFFVELQVENFKHQYDTLQLRIVIDVPINKTEYKTFESNVEYNFVSNTHNKLEFFPKELRNGVINFSIYKGTRFIRLETMRIRKPTLFPTDDDESNEGQRNIDPDFDKKKTK